MSVVRECRLIMNKDWYVSQILLVSGKPVGSAIERRMPCSQKISFGVMSTAEVVNTAELHVYERPLYSVSACQSS